MGNNIIALKTLIEKNVFYIHQIKNGDLFLTNQELNNKHNTRLNFLQYRSIINAIKTYTLQFQGLKSKKEIHYQPALNIIMT